MSTTTLQSLLHSDRSLGTECSSISSDTVYTVTDNHYYPRPPSDATILHAITQTMIGEFLYKYTRRMFYKGHGEKRHKRFFWLHPYTRTLYWSGADPMSSNVSEPSAKGAYINGVRSVLDPNPLPPGLHGYSIVVSTPTREVKFTAPSKDRHDIWINAIQYLFIRPGTSTLSSTANAPNGPGPASFGTITRGRDIDDSTQQSTDRGGAGDFCTPLRESEATEPGPKDYSVIRGRVPISANDPYPSAGRGAVGNIRSPSPSRDDIRGSFETLKSPIQPYPRRRGYDCELTAFLDNAHDTGVHSFSGGPGRHNRGNISGSRRSPSREPATNEPEDYSDTRGRDPIPDRDPVVITSTGRGGLGNLPSRSREPIREEHGTLEKSLIRSELRGRGYDHDTIVTIDKAHDTGVHSTSRGGTGNMTNSRPNSQSYSKSSQPESECAAHPQMLQSRALPFLSRGGVGNPECSEVPHREGAKNPYDVNHPHLTHSHDAESFGHGGSGNISHDLSREPEAENTHNPLSRFLHGLGGGGNLKGEVKY